jgi:DNA-binding SARP family transcriptional activator
MTMRAIATRAMTTTRVRILGPIDIVGPYGPEQVPGRRRKAVLTALALEPGRVVAVDRLVELVWGDGEGGAPKDPRNTLQQHVAYLRRILGDQAAIQGGVGGYLLRGRVIGNVGCGDDDGVTDAQVAERLVREALDETVPARRAELAATAAALWRGPALADVADLPEFRGAAWRLEQVRLRAGRLLVDSRLAMGLVEQACQDAEGMHRDHPADESVSGLLMVALYRAGRVGEALAVYRRTWRELREEYGMNPGAGLSRLYTAILRQDPELRE